MHARICRRLLKRPVYLTLETRDRRPLGLGPSRKLLLLRPFASPGEASTPRTYTSYVMPAEARS